jgi:DNA-binding protein Fis
MAHLVDTSNTAPEALPVGGLCESVKSLLKSAAAKLKGCFRRQFMAETVTKLGPGGQSRAERELGWNRCTIRKGLHEMKSGISCADAYSLRGRKRSEDRLPSLEDDIRSIVEPKAQADATLHTTRVYVKMTAEEVRQQLIDQKGYRDEDLPKRRTISTILNRMNLHLKKVLKNQPLKKLPETDAIFEKIHEVNREADKTEGVLRVSMDAKATVKLGPFSRGGRNRSTVKAADHDFGSTGSLTPFNILLPQHDELFISFAESKVTSDYMWDRLEELWPRMEAGHRPSVLVLNLDNGPENSSRRTQFIKRAVDFANAHQVTIQLAYYPPYHSKYNPVERTHGALEQYWNGMLLSDTQTAINIAGNMKWKGKHPVISLVTKIYEKGVKLTKKAMASYEKVIKRLPGLEDWFVEIPPSEVESG